MRFFLDLVSAILILLTARASVPRPATTATRNISYQLPERLKSNLQQFIAYHDPSRTRIELI